MVDTFSEKLNPCTFCVDSKNTNVRPTKNDEVLQFDLEGYDTKLYIRETSTHDFSKLQTEEDVNNGEDHQTEGSEERTECSVPTIEITTTRKTVRMTQAQLSMKPIDLLHVKRWSGKTYFEEELRKIKKKQYNEELEEAEKRRQLWKDFQKDIARERKRDLVKSGGPGWWQEPSSKQICLALNLGEVIKADFEEEVTGRTRQWLLDVGVTTKLTPKEVRSCMRKSLLEPVDFLLEIHRVVLSSQLKLKRKKGEFVKRFSVNERILLSAVCVIHLPTLLTVLHFILPPPKPWSSIKHIQELLFGDVEDERIRFFTPYMEPLPFRDPKVSKDWMFGRVFTALFPSLKPDLSAVSQDTRNVDKEINGKPGYIPRKSRLSQAMMKGIRESICKMKLGDSDPSVTWLITECISNRLKSESLFPVKESLSGENPFYSRNLSVISTTIVKTLRKSLKKQIMFDETTLKSSYSKLEAESMVSTSGKNTCAKSPNTTKESSFSEDTIERHGPIVTLPSCDETLDNNTYDFSDYQKSSHLSESLSSSSRMRKLTGEVKSMEEQSDKRQQELVSRPVELDEIWEEIKDLPKMEQLVRAIRILAEMGDPLARLPSVHKLPTLKRWLELRQGKNRVLTKKKKTELLSRSRGMWKMAPVGSQAKGPKIKCSKKTERLLTWDRKDWLSGQKDKELDKYFARVRQEKVDNSRSFFPTMLNAYDYGSKLNRSFRDVYYTYLPSKEADTLAYKPWQPGESKNKSGNSK